MEKKLTPTPLSEDVWMVPCHINREGNIFQPICNPLEGDSLKINIKQPWSVGEDKFLKKLIKTQRKKAWASIAREINKKFHNGKDVRKGKQCRERFSNHINPHLNKGNWLPEEDLYILEMQTSRGNKWSEIAKNLPGRNENQVKNRWKSLLNKAKTSDGSIIVTPITISPPTSFIGFKLDPCFSSLAEVIQIQYFSQTSDATPPFPVFFP